MQQKLINLSMAFNFILSPLLRAPVERQRLFLGTEYFVKFAVRRPQRDFLG